MDEDSCYRTARYQFSNQLQVLASHISSLSDRSMIINKLDSTCRVRTILLLLASRAAVSLGSDDCLMQCYDNSTGQIGALECESCLIRVPTQLHSLVECGQARVEYSQP